MADTDTSRQLTGAKVSKEFFSMYQNHFLPAYSDLVVLTADKPSPILLEVEAAFTHLMKFVMNEDAEKNLTKAKGHIYRASVDCYKQIWEFIYETVSEVDRYRGAYEGMESELLPKSRKLSDIMADARLREEESVGAEDEMVLDLWKDALTIGLDIYHSTNKTILAKLKRSDMHKGMFPTYIYPFILSVGTLVIGILIGKLI